MTYHQGSAEFISTGPRWKAQRHTIVFDRMSSPKPPIQMYSAIIRPFVRRLSASEYRLREYFKEEVLSFMSEYFCQKSHEKLSNNGTKASL